MDVFNSNGEAYENAWDLPPVVDCGGSATGCRGGQGCSCACDALGYLNSELFL